MLMKNITTIQKQVEGRNFDIRKHILEYDDVLNHHRLAIYSRRAKILSGADIHTEVLEMLRREVDRIVDISQGPEIDLDLEDTTHVMEAINEFAESSLITADDLASAESYDEIKNRIFSILSGKIETLRDTGTEEEFAEFERRLTLASIDELWMHHIDSMAHLREEVAFE
jgi:preprotein translocase subunit SecA